LTYTLGVDLGTTFTSAAVLEAGSPPRIVDLAGRQATMPSVVFLAEDGGFMVGEPAIRRSVDAPDRAARQFKRRFGDSTPLFLGGSPMSADALTAELLRAVVDLVTEQQGGPPDRVAITYPANWGGFKLELLEQAIRRSGLEEATTITEPEAAVLHYSQLERVPAGSTVAVFDLGGGTFDAAVIHKTADGTEFLGQPEGIERLGGIDFDEAMFSFVKGHLGTAVDELDLSVAADRSALERLRADCVAAKEALSADETVSIPVILPNLNTTVRVTRGEFEELVRPTLSQAIEALRRAVASSGVEASELTAVLLAGGSSRIPLVAEMVGGELARPVAVDTHPKHVVAMGAALAANDARAGDDEGPETAAAPPPAPAAADEPEPPVEPAPKPTPEAPPSTVAGPPPSPAPKAPPVRPPTPPKAEKRKSRVGLLVGLAVVIAAAVGAFLFMSGGGDDTGSPPSPTTTTPPAPTDAPVALPPTTDAPATTPAVTEPPVTDPVTTTMPPPVTDPVTTTSPPATSPPTTQGLPQDFGDDPILDGFYSRCAAGDFIGCDELYFNAPAGSNYEAFGATCGGQPLENLDGACQQGYPPNLTITELAFDDSGVVGAGNGVVIPGGAVGLVFDAVAGDTLEVVRFFVFPDTGAVTFEIYDPDGDLVADTSTIFPISLTLPGRYGIEIQGYAATSAQYFEFFLSLT
jgi:actin-like ATPase involved in cell morphogenesis